MWLVEEQEKGRVVLGYSVHVSKTLSDDNCYMCAVYSKLLCI